MPEDTGELVKKAAADLGEYYDSVQIFATRHESGEREGTVHAAWGIGNFYARYGQVREWLVTQEEGTRQQVRKESGEG